MARKTVPSQAEIEMVFDILSGIYEDPSTELTYESPFQLLIAVILSAQCTDARVNQTTPALFAKYPTAHEMAAAKQSDIEKLIHSCGFYKMKAKALIQTSKDLLQKFKGEVPSTIEELVTLRGVGRKTASVILNQAFATPAIAVDTHVSRVSQRLGWVKSTDPVKIEMELRELLPTKLWIGVNGYLILHGRRLCKARKPQCEACEINQYCAFYRSLKKRK